MNATEHTTMADAPTIETVTFKLQPGTEATEFVEAAKVLAERMQIEGGDNPKDQITFAFRTATCRYPTEKELELLVRLF